MGQVISTPCATCKGEGRVIESVTYQVDVPGGVDTGATLRLNGRGAVGPRGGVPGDLYVHIRVAAHPTLQREDDDLVHVLDVGIAQAALGAKFTIETLEGDEEITVPAGTQHGHEIMLKGRGVPHLNSGGRRRGDLRVIVRVVVPTKLTDAEEKLLRDFAALRGDAIAEADKGLKSRIKSAFS
jgi:molecular chaperone DnaJ